MNINDVSVGALCVISEIGCEVHLWNDWVNRIIPRGHDDDNRQLVRSGDGCIALSKMIDDKGYRGVFVMTISGLYGWIYVDFLVAL